MKKVIFLVTLLVGVLGGVLWFVSYQRSFGNIKIVLDENVGAVIYKQPGEDENENPPVLVSFTKEFVGKLKDGIYVVENEASADFSKESTSFEVKDDTQVDIKVSYSTNKLAGLLVQEQTNINEAFTKKYPELPGGYRLGQGKLFEKGNWYGALVIPNNNELDFLRFVMQKGSDKWELVTQPPDIILSSVIYPDIPRAVLQAVNSL